MTKKRVSEKLDMGIKKLRAAIESRRINFLKKTKLKFGVPKKVPDFRTQMIKIFDGKKHE
jgi:hypothetical protein